MVIIKKHTQKKDDIKRRKKNKEIKWETNHNLTIAEHYKNKIKKKKQKSRLH